jgi:hypothetical protein
VPSRYSAVVRGRREVGDVSAWSYFGARLGLDFNGLPVAGILDFSTLPVTSLFHSTFGSIPTVNTVRDLVAQLPEDVENTLDAAPEASELAIWSDVLADKGGDRGEVLLSIFERPEHEIALPGLPVSKADLVLPEAEDLVVGQHGAVVADDPKLELGVHGRRHAGIFRT